jgi:hypothetical protein
MKTVSQPRKTAAARHPSASTPNKPARLLSDTEVDRLSDTELDQVTGGHSRGSNLTNTSGG